MDDNSIPDFDIEHDYSQEISEMQNINSENIEKQTKKVTKAEMKKLEKEKKIREKEEFRRIKELEIEAAKLAKK